MFNVSALQLDDALKPATPLTNGATNETPRLVFNPISIHKPALAHCRRATTRIVNFRG